MSTHAIVFMIEPELAVKLDQTAPWADLGPATSPSARARLVLLRWANGPWKCPAVERPVPAVRKTLHLDDTTYGILTMAKEKWTCGFGPALRAILLAYLANVEAAEAKSK